MPTITYKGQAYTVDAGQTILDALNSNGVELASGCKVGACQTCMLKAHPGPDLSAWQANLSTRQAKQRLFVTCIAKPTEDMELVDPKESIKALSVKMSISDLQFVSKEIVSIKLKTDQSFRFLPGQFVNLSNEEGVSRPYSIASIPSDKFLEFHIRLLDDGKMSNYLKNKAKVGAIFQCSEASGICSFPPKASFKNLCLLGTGTGLAPLWSIARQAISDGFQGEINIFHGASNLDGMYHVDECHRLANENPQVHYYPCLSRENIEGFHHGRADELALSTLDDVSETAIYLCGHPDMVKSAQKKFFLKGSALALLFSDPFTISGS
jgi:NAD(P)H-flavin reductase/ferredoxin